MSKYSFKSLFEVPLDLGNGEQVVIEKVEIPRIQRDYAQGRMIKRNGDTRLNDQGSRFLDSILSHLQKGTPMEMDFIYGATEGRKFLPLDGQQRLTTLYLLYWYIGNKELEDKEELHALLKKFSYETRATARQFCEQLSSVSDLDYETVSISKQLRDFAWYSRVYDLDPTVVAMMNMLDEIQHRYLELGQVCYDNLEQLTFSVLALNRFRLTDELYIKMNARGKQLTNFENLKADLINWMTKSKGFLENQDYKGQSMPHHMVFSNKIDNEWTDALWSLSNRLKDTGNNTIVDDLFFSLIYRWLLFEFILESGTSNREMDKDPLFKYLQAENEYSDFKQIKPLLTDERLERFEHAMDLFSDATNSDHIYKDSVASWSSSPAAYFLFGREITLPQRVALYGIWVYLCTNKTFDADKFRQWMRVVWNIVENTDIDSWRIAIGVIQLLHELGQYSDDIYSNYPNTLKSDHQAAIDERRKIDFIGKDPSWENAFIEAEKHPFLRGGIDFMIEDEMTIDAFKHRTDIANKVFGDKGVQGAYLSDHLLLRAIISRYSSIEQLLERKNFTDTDEKEHYLKKMLASDKVAKAALRDWLSSKDEGELIRSLQEATGASSKVENTDAIPFGKKMHEDLYKEPHLQNWMQDCKATRFAQHFGGYFVSKPNAWYNWVMLDSYRDDIINALVTRFGLESPQHIKGAKYHIFKSIDLKRPVLIHGLNVTFIYTFREDGFLLVGIKEGMEENDSCMNALNNIPFSEDDKEDGWVCRKEYNYKADVPDPSRVKEFIDTIETDVFDPSVPSSLVSRIADSVASTQESESPEDMPQ